MRHNYYLFSTVAAGREPGLPLSLGLSRLGVKWRRRGSPWPSSPGLLCPGRRRRASVTVARAGHGFYHYYVLCIMYSTLHIIIIMYYVLCIIINHIRKKTSQACLCLTNLLISTRLTHGSLCLTNLLNSTHSTHMSNASAAQVRRHAKSINLGRMIKSSMTSHQHNFKSFLEQRLLRLPATCRRGRPGGSVDSDVGY